MFKTSKYTTLFIRARLKKEQFDFKIRTIQCLRYSKEHSHRRNITGVKYKAIIIGSGRTSTIVFRRALPGLSIIRIVHLRLPNENKAYPLCLCERRPPVRMYVCACILILRIYVCCCGGTSSSACHSAIVMSYISVVRTLACLIMFQLAGLTAKQTLPRDLLP